MMEPDDSILVAVLSCVSSAVLTWGRPFGLGRPPAHVGLDWINLLWADGQCSGPAGCEAVLADRGCRKPALLPMAIKLVGVAAGGQPEGRPYQTTAKS